MSVHSRTRRGPAVLVLALLAAWPIQAQEQSPLPIDVTARTTVRNETARSLVPLLRDVKRRANPGLTVKRGSVPDSPITGTQTTLFAVTIGERAVPVHPEVLEAMDRLLAWKIGDPGAEAEAALFEDWLGHLSARSASFSTSGLAVCDAACVVKRMTTLDESWGAAPGERAEMRDEALLDALAAAVSK